ncbi:hypothetical protein ACFQT0_21265 [Hymenobacter humi]|uniref:Uncharacterized protein n=1 Tax=Hymenobacter humi TaxID=1411620 RepID=A0ABW2U9X2_9BACT
MIDKLLGELHCKLAIMHVSRAESHSEAAGRRAVYEVRRSGLAALPEEETAHLVCNADAATGILQGADEPGGRRAGSHCPPAQRAGQLIAPQRDGRGHQKSTIPVLVLPALN